MWVFRNARPAIAALGAWALVGPVGGCGTLSANNVPNRGDDDEAAADADPGGTDGPAGDDDDNTDVNTVIDSGTPTDTGSTTETTPETTPVPCGSFPNVGLTGLSAGAAFTPTYMGLFVSGAVDQGAVEDYTLWDVDAGSAIDDVSAAITFLFYDAAFTPQCQVVYDLSQVAGPASAWTAASPVQLWDAWDLALSGAQTDCGQLTGGSFTVNNAPALVQSYQWNIGFGPMSQQLVNQIEPQVTAAGGSWANDWDPYVFSMYVATDIFGGVTVQEMDYVFELDRTCENVVVDAALYGTVLGVPNGPLTGYANAQSFIVVHFQ